jgi:ethanolamine utilization protein EutN
VGGKTATDTNERIVRGKCKEAKQASLGLAIPGKSQAHKQTLDSRVEESMFLGRVMGTATSTVKHPSMEGWKLLLVRALQADGKTAEGDPILVVDSLGAGRGELIMITSDGIGTRELLKNIQSPVRWSVLGICDE